MSNIRQRKHKRAIYVNKKKEKEDETLDRDDAINHTGTYLTNFNLVKTIKDHVLDLDKELQKFGLEEE